MRTYIGSEYLNKEKMKEHEVIDNFLPQKELSELQTFLLSSEYIDNGVAQIIPWQYYHNPSNGITEQVDETTINRDTTWKLFYYFHEVYNYTILSPYVFKKLKLLRELLDVKSFIRIKINMYPYTETLKEYGMHTDLILIIQIICITWRVDFFCIKHY